MYKSCLFFLGVMLALSCGSSKAPLTQLFPVGIGDTHAIPDSLQKDDFMSRLSKKYGYIDRAGNMVIAVQFRKAGCFTDGLALAAIGDSNTTWGYIDNTGRYIIPATYVSASSFSDGVAFVVPPGGAPVAIDKAGAVQFTLAEAASAESFRDGLAAFSIAGPNGETWGFVDKKGATVIPVLYRAVGYFSQGLCGVMNDKGKWGFINKKGDIVIDFRYDNVFPFDGGKARVSLGNKWGVIDNKGKELLSPQYAGIDIDGDSYLVNSNGKWGWIDSKGKTTIAAQYTNAYPFNGSKYAAVQQAGKWGYIDAEGKMAIAPSYDFAFAFDGDLALVQTNKKYGFINDKGASVITPVYDNVATDYFVSRLSGTSAFYSVKSDKNQPGIIAWKWLNCFYHMEYDEALRLSTTDTRGILTSFNELTALVTDSSKKEMLGVIVGIKDTKISDNKAIVTYTLSDSPGKDQLLFLVNENGRWLVQFSKNDLLGEGDTARADG